MGRPAFSRRTFLIDKALQLKFIYLNMVFLMVVSVGIAGLLYVGIWYSITSEFSTVQLQEDVNTINRMQEYERVRTRQVVETIPFVREQAQLLSHHQKAVLGSILANSNKRIIPVVLFFFAGVFIVTLLVTHRIAGPLYRIKKNLAQVKQGDLKVKFSLRDGDDAKDLAHDLQDVFSGLSHDMHAAQELIDSLESSTGEDDRKKHLSALKSLLSRYNA